VSLFEESQIYKKRALDSSIDAIRLNFGDTSVVRGSFINSGIPPLMGGVAEDFPNMRSIL
jgi:DNA polymerase-4